MDVDSQDRLQGRSSIWEREEDAGMLVKGVPETAERRERRLRSEGRFESYVPLLRSTNYDLMVYQQSQNYK